MTTFYATFTDDFVAAAFGTLWVAPLRAVLLDETYTFDPLIPSLPDDTSILAFGPLNNPVVETRKLKADNVRMTSVLPQTFPTQVVIFTLSSDELLAPIIKLSPPFPSSYQVPQGDFWMQWNERTVVAL